MEAWLKDAAGIHPVVSNAAAYAERWKLWWIECQPSARGTASWPLLREPLSVTQWGRLMNGGKHGIFLFVMSLSWWARSLELAPSSPDLTAVIGDLDWVLHQLTDSLTPTTLMPSVEASITPGGKRKVVLTEKAMASGDNVQKRFRRK